MASNLIRKILGRLKATIRTFLSKPYQVTYSQSGEDLMISFACASFGITQPTYIDIGANDPVRLSNTYLFYLRGSSGILVEPNPQLTARLSRARPRDRVVTCGVGSGGGEKMPFYILSSSFMSTFSKSEAESACARGGFKQIGVVEVPVFTIEDICNQELGGGSPDIISIDVEGMDKEIVTSTNWEQVRPAILCIETREFAPDWTGKIVPEISETLVTADYEVFSATYFNTIYVDTRRKKGA